MSEPERHPDFDGQVLKQNLHPHPIGGIKIACFVEQGNGVLTPSRRLPHYSLVYITRGNGSYRDANGVVTEVSAGDAIILLPDVEHWYGPNSDETWDEYYLVFEGPVFDTWREAGFFDDINPVLSLKPLAYWRRQIQQFISGPQARNDAELLKETIRLQQLLAEVCDLRSSQKEHESEWLVEAKAALTQTLDVRAAARELGEPYETFRKRFRRIAGLPPGQFISALRIERACRMLHCPDSRLRNIADELGYYDEYHLGRQFKKTMGCSTSEYRMKARRLSERAQD